MGTVPLLAGSDLARQTGLIQPGIGLHRELEELVAIGLSPAEALRAATWLPAAALGREKESGGVAVGMAADLVLLEANPLEDIRNTREIAAVLLRGKVLLADELHGLRGSATPSR